MKTSPRVLVVYKKSAYQIYVREGGHRRVAALLRSGDAAVAGMTRAHRDHEHTLIEARRVLRALGARAEFRPRSGRGSASAFDLVVTLGGDGTLLWASHGIAAGSPVVAINSAPADSVGYFCAATRESIGDTLADALAGKLRETRLTRMQVEIDSRVISRRVLNDALFSHVCPAATTRYAIRLRGRHESQRSSGVWVATAAGSSAAIGSAGGGIQPIGSSRLQFMVREPYAFAPTPYALRHGFFKSGERLELQSHVRDGRLYLDGPHMIRVVEIGSKLSFSRSIETLSLLGFRRR
jgi:NAD+ kinase